MAHIMAAFKTMKTTISRLLILSLFFLPLQRVQAQHCPTPGRAKLLADFDLYRSILEKTHAGLYKYHSKEQIDSIFATGRKQITATTDVCGFYRQLAVIMSYIGSLHDDISLPDKLRKQLFAMKRYFPYPVKLADGKLLINIDGEKMAAGTEIHSINGVPVQQIIPGLYKYYTTDGFNISGKSEGINVWFPWFYFLEYGAAASFRVNDSITLPAVSMPEYGALYKKRHSLPLDTAMGRNYSFRLVDSLRAAILTVPTFALGNAESAEHAAYKKFLANSFSTLKAKNIRHLIVDIRGNGGGTDPNDLLTFSYLAYQPFKENASAFTLFQRVPYRLYCTDDTADVRDLEENLEDEHDRFVEGRYYQNPDYCRFWQPDSLAFRGDLYLLVDPAVASAASLFAAMVRSEGHARVIGAETMGGYYGHTGHNSLSYRLPQSGITFSISVVDLEQYVQPRKEISRGEGILPDISIHNHITDFLNNHDAVMDSVLHLVGQQRLEMKQRLGKKELLADLMYYRDTLPVKHKNLFNKISKAEFEQKVAAVAGNIDSLNEESFMIALYKLNVSIGDEHTRIEPRFKQGLPIQFTTFNDGIFVTGIAPPQSAMLLWKLIAINGHPIDEINQRFREVFKADNASYFEIYMQRYLDNPVFLKGLGILSSDENAEFTLRSGNNETRRVTLYAAGRDSLQLVSPSQYTTLLPYKQPDKNYWYEYDPERKTMYFNFAHCIEDERQPFPEFNKELFSSIDSLHPDKIIVDLRFNDGGNSGVLTPFMDSIQQSYLNKKRHLYVLIGKQTFSSALMNAVRFKRYTKATLVGQMTSGNINHYGEVRGFRLPNTKIVIGYSTRYWENWKGKKGALMPDTEINYSAINFINNKDEALEYIYQR